MNVLGAGWVALTALATLFTGAHSVLLSLSKVDGVIPFSSASVVMLQELLKLVMCSAMLMLSHDFRQLEPSMSMLLYAIPAISYAVNNNLAVYLQTQMDAATFQVLCNLKIGTTAILYRAMLGIELRRDRWIAIGLLCVGGMISTMGAHSVVSANEVFVTPIGFLVMLVYCFNSGFSGVYTEKIMKSRFQMSIFAQGVLLYAFGTLVNLIAVFNSEPLETDTYEEDNNIESRGLLVRLFGGFSWLTAVIIVTQALNGVFFSVIMKHASNILRLFIISGAMLVSAVLSRVLLSLQLSGYFWIAFFCVGVAVCLYYARDIWTSKNNIPK